MKYGELPTVLKGEFEVNDCEMMFYQYLPIKMPNTAELKFEKRLDCFSKIIGTICCDFIGEFGLNKYMDSYIYVSAKHMYQPPFNSYNRLGYHADGFMTNDINYIWCNANPTIFNNSEFNLTMDDHISMLEMEQQALEINEITYPVNKIVRLNQFNIHKVNESSEGGFRTFIKISFSEDKYDLIGNSHNFELNYNWEMKKRKVERNIPQTINLVK